MIFEDKTLTSEIKRFDAIVGNMKNFRRYQSNHFYKSNITIWFGK